MRQRDRFVPLPLHKPARYAGVMPQFNKVRNTMRCLSIVLILFLSACGQSLTDDTAFTEQSSDANSSFKYQCDSGKAIMVSYSTDSEAVVEYEDRRLQMKIVVSGSGARYAGERLEWWTKGSGEGASGTLFRHLEDGTSGEVIEQCAQVADAATNRWSGTFATQAAPASQNPLNSGVKP